MPDHFLARSCLALFSLAAAVSLALPTTAQTFPTKPVRLVVPQTPGGATDVFGRAIGQKLSERWGQPVVIENRAGAGGVIGTDLVAKSAPDGTTLLMTYEGSQAINQSLYKNIPYDSVKDFQPVATLAVMPFFLVVNAKFQARDLKEYIALATAKPEEITYASSGNGSVNHLLGEMLRSATGIRIVHIPYKGVAPAMTDLIGGQVASGFASVPAAIQHLEGGTLRAIAVSSAERNKAAPDVKTIAEQGVPGFEVNPWWGILAPAGTPMPIVEKINADIRAVVDTAEMHAFYRKQGADPYLTTPAEFAARLEADVRKWAKVVASSGARLD